MFLLPWAITLGNEKSKKDKAKLIAAKQERPGDMEVPRSDENKRKRSSSGCSPRPDLDRRPEKKRVQGMNHGEVATGNGSDSGLVEGENLSGGHEAGSPIPSVPTGLDVTTGLDHQKMNEYGHDLPVSSPLSSVPASLVTPGPDRSTPSTGAAPCPSLRDVIESQFSLEILLKHKELRLIDQEISKCQVSLEQLRRCRTIPFPSMSSDYRDMVDVSSGSGPALELPNRDIPPTAPPPWGISEGPYARHYAKWLLPDPSFDGGAADGTASSNFASTLASGMRGGAGKRTNSVPSRSQRGSTGSRLQPLLAGYTAPKEEKGPLILKRATDGRMVKLVCLDCRRENFNTAQGFINHCRIQHDRKFASHGAASRACGQEIELSELGDAMVEHPAPSSAGIGLVHPLTRSARMDHLAPSTPGSSTSRRNQPCQEYGSTFKENFSACAESEVITVRRPNPFPSSQTPFTPSPNTPYLSAMLKRSGCGGDLSSMVTEAKVKVDFEGDYPSEDDDGDDETAMKEAVSPRIVQAPLGTRLPARSTMSPMPIDRPPSRKGLENKCKVSFRCGYLRNTVPDVRDTIYSSPYVPPSVSNRSDVSRNASSGHRLCQYPNPSSFRTKQQPLPSPNLYREERSVFDHQDHHDQHNNPFNLSPNTVESQTAPSLVSDDGMDFENTHSEASRSPSLVRDSDSEKHHCLGDDVEFDEHDGDGYDGRDSAGAGLGFTPGCGLRGRPSAPGEHVGAARHDGRHVRFAGSEPSRKRREEK